MFYEIPSNQDFPLFSLFKQHFIFCGKNLALEKNNNISMLDSTLEPVKKLIYFMKKRV